jgi:hypothetical protein
LPEFSGTFGKSKKIGSTFANNFGKKSKKIRKEKHAAFF